MDSKHICISLSLTHMIINTDIFSRKRKKRTWVWKHVYSTLLQVDELNEQNSIILFCSPTLLSGQLTHAHIHSIQHPLARPLCHALTLTPIMSTLVHSLSHAHFHPPTPISNHTATSISTPISPHVYTHTHSRPLPLLSPSDVVFSWSSLVKF